MFRFSPRPNRAAEIHWQTWSQESFDRAVAEDKVILLSISAVWCHWCHVMDEQTYSDQTVIHFINEHFIAMRVDNDERPDINARYNMGGWPTTALLTAKGEIISGATYVPPSAMHALLDRVLRFYAAQKEHIATHLAQARVVRDSRQAVPSIPSEPDPKLVGEILSSIIEQYDEENGGFGSAPKFPQSDALAFLLATWRLAQMEEQRAEKRREIRSGVVTTQSVFTQAAMQYGAILRKTLSGMIYGGLYDVQEGGFYRYATQADWSVPHYEKMTEDHALLLPVIAGVYRITRDDDLKRVLQETWQWIRSTLYDERTGLFGGSQDADETYAALDAAVRRTQTIPFVDRSSYTQHTAALAGALWSVADVLEDEAIERCATSVLDALHDRLRDAAGLLFHVLPAGDAEPRVTLLLTDQVAYLGALLDAYEYGGEQRFLQRAQAIADLLLATFWRDGRLCDHGHNEDLGALAEPEYPLRENASAAESFMRLAVLLEDSSYRVSAENILRMFSEQARSQSVYAAKYAQVLSRAVTPSSTLRIHAPSTKAQAFRRHAKRLPDPYLIVSSVPPSEGESVAYLCRGTVCAAPTFAAPELRSAWNWILAAS